MAQNYVALKKYERAEEAFDQLVNAQRQFVGPETINTMISLTNIGWLRLEQGKFADLLVLHKNPLESAENYRSISVVMKEGKIVDRDALPTKRLLTASSED